jgi:hypothetical protein
MTDIYSPDDADEDVRRPEDRFQDRFAADAYLVALRQGRYPIAAAVGALANGLARPGRARGWLRRLSSRKGTTGQ